MTKKLSKDFHETIHQTGRPQGVPRWRKVFVAADTGRLKQLLKYIDEEGFDVNVCNEGGYTPLGYAVSSHHKRIVAALIARKADVNIPNAQGWTPLTMAAIVNDGEIFKMLLQAGADPYVRSKSGETLREIAHKNDADRVLAILDNEVFQCLNPKTSEKINEAPLGNPLSRKTVSRKPKTPK